MQFLFSCQKGLTNDPLPTVPPVADSVVLVKSILGEGYDSNDKLIGRGTETYDYDTLLNRTVVTHRDSSSSGIESYTETFQYNTGKQLSQYSSTQANAYVTKIDFTYDGSGNISKAVITDRLVGSVDCLFKVTTQGTNKMVSMYDTSGKGKENYDFRPLITHFTFDADSKLVRLHEYSTYADKSRPHWFEDTIDVTVAYDGNNNASKTIFKYDLTAASFPQHIYDSVLLSRETTDKALANSFLAIYRNLYWFYTAETINASFSGAMVHNTFVYPHYLYYAGAPMKTAERWTSYPPAPAVIDYAKGTMTNTYNSAGQLSSTTYPKGFGNKYDGKNTLAYSYVKIKKPY